MAASERCKESAARVTQDSPDFSAEDVPSAAQV
jgi:hypothetical protein